MTTPEPQISVVVPTKDRDRWLPQTLRSISWQRGVAFEALVVDDGSAEPDLVAGIVAALGDPRFRILRHDRSQGVSAARNHGMREARAAWVAFCDDDDLWAPDKLAKQVAVAEQAPAAAWSYVGAVNVAVDNRVVGGEPPPPPDAVVERLEELNIVPGGASGVAARRDVLLEVGGFDGALQPLADWDLWLRLLRAGPPVCVAEPLVAYRVHGSNMSLDSGRVEADFAILAERYPRASRLVLWRYLGWWSLRVGRRRAAARYFLRAAVARDAPYPVRLRAYDWRYVGMHVIREVRARYAPACWKPAPLKTLVRHPEWREDGQRWVDQLSASRQPRA